MNFYNIFKLKYGNLVIGGKEDLGTKGAEKI